MTKNQMLALRPGIDWCEVVSGSRASYGDRARVRRFERYIHGVYVILETGLSYSPSEVKQIKR